MGVFDGADSINRCLCRRRRLRKREKQRARARHFAARANIAPSTVSFSHSLRLDNVITHTHIKEERKLSLFSLSLSLSPASPAAFASRRSAVITRIGRKSNDSQVTRATPIAFRTVKFVCTHQRRLSRALYAAFVSRGTYCLTQKYSAPFETFPRESGKKCVLLKKARRTFHYFFRKTSQHCFHIEWRVPLFGFRPGPPVVCERDSTSSVSRCR